MFFNSRSLCKAALFSFFALETSALVLQPYDPSSTPLPQPAHQAKRNDVPPVNFFPVGNFGEGTGNSHEKREMPGHSAFDPSSQSEFLWGAYAGDNFYKANFTLKAPGNDELILPVEQFAKHLKSITCGQPGHPMVLDFNDQESYEYAQKQWQWVNKEDINHFILVTEANQCYQGDDRSPYLVHKIMFDPHSLQANIIAEERPWKEIAHSFHLNVGHEYIDPATAANITHPRFARRDESKIDLHSDFNQQLFNFAKDSSDTAGLALGANAHISTGGFLITDFDIEVTVFIPTDVNIDIHPQGAWGEILLDLNVDGTLGKGLDWTMTPEIEIPVGALNIKGLLEIGPFVTMGVHFGSSALTGTGTLSTGAKATLKDSAEVKVKLRDAGQNSIKDWDPQFEKIDPTFSAEISGDIRAWGELGIMLKAEVLGRWGYQASVDAELPYFEATMAGKLDEAGVCGTMKTKGIDLEANVGINVHLDAGQVDKSPDFEKDLFDTKWPLFSTCIGVGDDDVKTEEPTVTSTEQPMPTSSSYIPPTSSVPLTTGPPMPTGTGYWGTGTGAYGTGTASGGWPVTANTTFMRMARRKPTQLY